ncbi:MAG: hypothetical protein J2P17_01195 [Mycobacterium sp.]|nr:hypothetical protein [Mycobacterium sp.]
MSGAQPPLSAPDPAPVVNAAEEQLTNYLHMPTEQILDQPGVQQIPSDQSAALASLPAHSAGPGLGSLDPSQLMSPIGMISPVAQALSALGTGGLNPSMLSGIPNAVNGAAGPLQQALGAIQQGWMGEAGAAASNKTIAALRNGSDLTTQATGLGNSLAAAAADVGQARTRLIEIINEFFATVTAIGPNIIFPWGWAAVVTAAAHAVAEATETVLELQGSLAAHASAVTAIGTAIAVEVAPAIGTAASIAGSVLPTLLGVGTMGVGMTASMGATAAMAGISPAMSAASKAANPAASAAANTGALAGSTAKDSASAPSHVAPVKSAANGAAAGGGGATVPSVAPVPRLPGPTPPVTSGPSVSTHPAKNTQTRSSTSSMPLESTGMIGAPVSGASLAGGASGANSAHTAASFLHTTEHGGKVVGNRDTVPPPVIGELEPNQAPDIQLRI